MPKVRIGGTYCWELRKGTSLHVFQGGQPEVRQAAGAWNLGIWPISAGVRLTAQEHAESADSRDLLLGITKRNLFACFARRTTRSSSTILPQAKGVHNLGVFLIRFRGDESNTD